MQFSYKPTTLKCNKMARDFRNLENKHEQLMTFEQDTVKPVLRHYCHKRPPVLKDHILAQRPSLIPTCHQRPLFAETTYFWWKK